ncbi:hypothetical protein DSM112329_01715 [Paraconexibacter sp. AEG42_29]|uniref:PIN domain-containing protein n=1 Tax=Paraconexibacter sp. AEG42_29 TaxID=2997339 RepID=A0AAU7AT82_9ACTN
MTLVIDASVAVGVLLGAEDALEVFASDDHVNAPQMLPIETLSALRGLLRSRQIDAGQAERAAAALTEMPVDLWDHQPLIEAVWARRDQLSAYDAAYLATAETLQASLVTGDRGLAERARAALGADRVVLLKDQ